MENLSDTGYDVNQDGASDKANGKHAAHKFESWVIGNKGLYSLLQVAEKFAPFPGGLRLVALPTNNIVVMGRISKNSGEIPVMTIHDWVGGFQISVISAERQFVLPPIAPEIAVCSFLREIGVHIEKSGLPADISAFRRDGALSAPEFHPLEPSRILLKLEAIGCAQSATMSAIDAGAKRIAPMSAIPDSYYDGLPVFDIRVDHDVLDASAKMSGAPMDIVPLMVRGNSMGGQPYFILLDGTKTGSGWLTWGRSANYPTVNQVFLDAEKTSVESPPEHVLSGANATKNAMN